MVTESHGRHCLSPQWQSSSIVHISLDMLQPHSSFLVSGIAPLSFHLPTPSQPWSDTAHLLKLNLFKLSREAHSTII